MTNVAATAISCGVYQVYHLGGQSQDVVKRIMGAYKRQAQANGRRNGFAQIIWSDADIYGNGERVARYLAAQFPRAAPPVKLSAKRSPSTQRNISTWMWNIPHTSFKKHKFYATAVARPHNPTY